MAQMLSSPQVPSDFKKFIMQANDVSSRAIAKVLENFEDTEPDSTVVDISKSMDVNKCIAQSADIIAQQQQAQQQAEQQAGQQAGGPPTGMPPGPQEMPIG
jgi:hypothetical protein